MSEIYLTIDKNLSCLAGYDFGYSLSSEQIIPSIKSNGKYTIYFPKHIDFISTGSFLSGIYSAIQNKCKDFILENIEFILLSDNSKITYSDY